MIGTKVPKRRRPNANGRSFWRSRRAGLYWIQGVRARTDTESGFTLLELIVVVALVAIFIAVALPRFEGLVDDAHDSTVRSTGGALASAVTLVHSQWLASRQGGAMMNLAGYGAGTVDVNAAGWPYDSAGSRSRNMSAEQCSRLWRALLHPNAPTVAPKDGADFKASGAGSVCVYVYQRQHASPPLSIAYNASNGVVTISVP